MSTSRFESRLTHFPLRGLTVREPRDSEPQQEENLYETFLQMRDLLEAYAPPWYSNDLRNRIQAVEPPKER